MPDYRVTVQRTEVREADIEVSGMTPGDAEVFAKDQAGDVDFGDKSVVDVSYEITGVTEVKSHEEIEEELVDTVIHRIVRDVIDGDRTAVHELLGYCPKENLIGYLPDDEAEKFRNRLK